MDQHFPFEAIPLPFSDAVRREPADRVRTWDPGQGEREDGGGIAAEHNCLWYSVGLFFCAESIAAADSLR